MNKIKILAVDNDASCLKHLENVLNQPAHVFTAASGFHQGVESLRSGFFNLVISEVNLKKKSGIHLLDIVHMESPETAVILTAEHFTVELLIEALRRQAADFIPKPLSGQVLLERIERILDRLSAKKRTILFNIIQMFDNKLKVRMITTREKEIIYFLLQGYRYQEIADRLFISYQTVKTHVNRIYRKLDITSRGQLFRHFFNLQDEID